MNNYVKNMRNSNTEQVAEAVAEYFVKDLNQDDTVMYSLIQPRPMLVAELLEELRKQPLDRVTITRSFSNEENTYLLAGHEVFTDVMYYGPTFTEWQRARESCSLFDRLSTTDIPYIVFKNELNTLVLNMSSFACCTVSVDADFQVLECSICEEHTYIKLVLSQ